MGPCFRRDDECRCKVDNATPAAPHPRRSQHHAHLPEGFDDFVDLVVPILQERGLFRGDYEGETLRDHLGLPRPPSDFGGDVPSVFWSADLQVRS